MTRLSLPACTLVACLLAACAPACSKDPAPPAASQTPADGIQVITGRERIGWDQLAPDAEELRDYTYVLYVDGVAAALPSAACGALAGEGPTAACASPLPPLSSGRHTLELATRITRGATVLESARSAPMVVTVTGSASAATAPPAAPITDMPGADGVRFQIEMLVSGLDTPSALARLPDGRLLVAERGGRIRIAEGGRLLDAPALELTDADTSGDQRVSLAVAPDFAATRHVYVSYAARDATRLRVGRVVRYREAGGTFGEAAVMLDNLPAEVSAPRIRIGPDAALYVGTTALDPQEADDLGSYAGKVLRFTAAGVTPSDNPIRFSPVFSFGHRGRVDFDWDPATRALWHVETDTGEAGGVSLGRAETNPGEAASVSLGRAETNPGETRGVSLGRTSADRRSTRAVRLEAIQSAGVAFHTGATPAAWRDSLFLASPDEACLYRVTGLSSSPPSPAIEPLLVNAYGRITAVLSADDGLYFATGNGGTDQRGRPADAVYRISDSPVLKILPARRGP